MGFELEMRLLGGSLMCSWYIRRSQEVLNAHTNDAFVAHCFSWEYPACFVGLERIGQQHGTFEVDATLVFHVLQLQFAKSFGFIHLQSTIFLLTLLVFHRVSSCTCQYVICVWVRKRRYCIQTCDKLLFNP